MFDERMGTSPKKCWNGDDARVRQLVTDGYGQWLSVRVGDWQQGLYLTQGDWSSNGEDSPGVVGHNSILPLRISPGDPKHWDSGLPSATGWTELVKVMIRGPACLDRPNGNPRQVRSHVRVQLQVSKRFPHLCLCNHPPDQVQQFNRHDVSYRSWNWEFRRFRTWVHVYHDGRQGGWTRLGIRSGERVPTWNHGTLGVWLEAVRES